MRSKETLIDRLERPDDEVLRSLRDDACETTRNRLERWGFADVDESTVRKLSYTYYHAPEENDQRYVFLLQDPGGLQRRHTEELNRLERIDERPSATELVDVYRQFPKSWLLRDRNADFSSKFFTTLADHGMVSFSSTWQDYLQDEAFYDDFYMTDVVKYRVDGPNSAEKRASVNEFLREELSTIDPELIFAFGGDAWGILRKHFDATPSETTSVDPGKIMQIHGTLCETGGEVDTKILPLSHMSGQVWWRFPPEEYIERMETGLREWKALGK